MFNQRELTDVVCVYPDNQLKEKKTTPRAITDIRNEGRLKLDWITRDVRLLVNSMHISGANS